MAKVAILIPLMRPWRIVDLVQNIAETTEDYHIYVIATGECADVTRPIGGVTLIDDGGGTWPQRMNLGYQSTTEPYFFTGSDDSRFHPDWLVHAMRTMEKVDGVVTVADMYNGCGTLSLISRRYIDEESGVMDEPKTVIHPGYVHNYSETELQNTARRRERYAYEPQAMVEHLFWGAGKAPHDETYQFAEGFLQQDFQLHMSRCWMWDK